MIQRFALYLYVVIFVHALSRVSSILDASSIHVVARPPHRASATAPCTRIRSCIFVFQWPSILQKKLYCFPQSPVHGDSCDLVTSSGGKFGTFLKRKTAQFRSAIIQSGRKGFNTINGPVKACAKISVGHRPLSMRSPLSVCHPVVAPAVTCNHLDREFITSATPSSTASGRIFSFSKKSQQSFGSLAPDTHEEATRTVRPLKQKLRCPSTKLRPPSTFLPAHGPALITRSESSRGIFFPSSPTKCSSPVAGTATRQLRFTKCSIQIPPRPTLLQLTLRYYGVLSPANHRISEILVSSRIRSLSRTASSSTTATCTDAPSQLFLPKHLVLSFCSNTTAGTLNFSHVHLSSYRPCTHMSKCCSRLFQHAPGGLCKSEPVQPRPVNRSTPFSPVEVAELSGESRGYSGRVAQQKRTRCDRPLRAVPLLPGVTRSDPSKNAEIPNFLLPPLFTAVEVADSNHAQSIVAFWKKPGVPRVGWTEDMIEMVHEHQRDAALNSGAVSFSQPPGEDTTLFQTRERDKTQRLRREGSAAGSASQSLTINPSPLSASATDGVADQGEALLIMTGSSPTHLDTLGEAVVEALWETHMRQVLGRDGRGFSGWVALSFMNLEVHIMTPVTRERYALEELYSLCPRIDVSDAVKVDRLEGFEFMSGGVERFYPKDPPFNPEVDADYGLFE